MYLIFGAIHNSQNANIITILYGL